MQCSSKRYAKRNAFQTQRWATQRSATQRNATQRNATQRKTQRKMQRKVKSTLRNAAQRSATQRNAAQRSATQRSATQRNAQLMNAFTTDNFGSYFINIFLNEITKTCCEFLFFFQIPFFKFSTFKFRSSLLSHKVTKVIPIIVFFRDFWFRKVQKFSYVILQY